MKKISILIFSLIASSTSLFAQIDNSAKQGENDDFGQRSSKSEQVSQTTTPGSQSGKVDIKLKHYKYEFSLGPRVGVGYSSMSQSDGLDVADGGGIGFGGGLALNVRFGNKNKRGQYLDGQGLFGVGLELNYKQHSIKSKGGNDDLKFGYFEVPIMFQIYPMYNSKQLKNLYIEVGPTIAGTISKSPDQLIFDHAIYKTGDLKGFDVKATFGVGYRFNKTSANDGFYVNARYYMGTSNLAGNFPGKIGSAELSVGYTFKCIGTKNK